MSKPTVVTTEAKRYVLKTNKGRELSAYAVSAKVARERVDDMLPDDEEVIELYQQKLSDKPIIFDGRAAPGA